MTKQPSVDVLSRPERRTLKMIAKHHPNWICFGPGLGFDEPSANSLRLRGLIKRARGGRGGRIDYFSHWWTLTPSGERAFFPQTVVGDDATTPNTDSSPDNAAAK